MGFNERLAECCVTSNLESKEGKIRDVEIVASLSAATHIGSDLMRARDYDAQALRRAILLIARKARQTLKIGMVPSQNLAVAVVVEIMHWQCRTCHGASEQIIGGVRQVCPTCGGTGVHRWTDAQRAKMAGYRVDTWHAWAPKYEKILAMARKEDSLTVPSAHAKLG